MNRCLAQFGLCLLAFVMLSGCQPAGPALFPVQGMVTLDGQPLAEGLVYFNTVRTGEVDTFSVKEGKFAGQALAGERRVEIVAYRMIPVAGEMGGEVQESLIASRYNSESELTAVVSPDVPNDYQFEVQSK